MNKMHLIKTAGTFALLTATWSIMVGGIIAEIPVATASRDFFATHGMPNTGAVNLVSAIYLGYRAFDTLGETIVLLLAIAGVVYMLGHGEVPT